VNDDTEAEDGQGEGEGEGKGKGKGKGQGEGEGEGQGDGQGEGEGNGSGSGRVSSGGGAGTGRGKGKKFEDVGDLPDPDQFAGQSIANPAAVDVPAGRAARGDKTVDDAALSIKRREFDEALKKIGMSEFDARKYDKVSFFRGTLSTKTQKIHMVLFSNRCFVG